MPVLMIPHPFLLGNIFIIQNSEGPQIDCCNTTLKPVPVKICVRQKVLRYYDGLKGTIKWSRQPKMSF